MFLTGKAPYPVERTLLTTGPGRGRHASRWRGTEAARDAAPGGPLPGRAAVDLLAKLRKARHACRRLATPDSPSRLFSRQRRLSHRSRLRVHAAAARWLEALRRRRRSLPARCRRPLGLAHLRVRGSPRVHARPAADRPPGGPQLARLLDGDPDTDIPDLDLEGNPYWPPEIAEADLPHERCVVLLPLALSRTQDDKGRVPLDPVRRQRAGAGQAVLARLLHRPRRRGAGRGRVAFFATLLEKVYGESILPRPAADIVQAETTTALLEAGFRILPAGEPLVGHWDEGPLPSWTEPFVLGPRQSLARVKYLLTFRPFARLPAPVRQAYLGRAAPAPLPRAASCSGARPATTRCARSCRSPCRFPLLHAITRHNAPTGLRVPQEGFFHVRQTVRLPSRQPTRTHRATPARSRAPSAARTAGTKVHRDQDELAELPEHEDEPILRGAVQHRPRRPRPVRQAAGPQRPAVDRRLADCCSTARRRRRHRSDAARQAVEAGGLFGYRFLYPAMRVGRHEVYWHRPLAAYRTPARRPALLPDAPTRLPDRLRRRPADARTRPSSCGRGC